MQTAKCEKCGQEFALNETLKIEGVTMCRGCGQKEIKERKNIKSVARQTDPTICVNCGKDNGSGQLPILAGLPVCPECENFLRHRPFPAWVKAFLIGVLAVTVFAFFWNIRYVQAYCQMRTALQYKHSNIEKSAELMESASKNVPECGFLRGFAAFYKGMALLQKDENKQALESFNLCRGLMPYTLNNTLENLIDKANIGEAFDDKNYDKFLALAIEHSNKNPDDAKAAMQLSSAYACKYATTGDEQFKQKSLDTLEKAKTLSTKKPFSKEYEERILYRLYTREIISTKEFKKRFPNGWTEPKKE